MRFGSLPAKLPPEAPQFISHILHDSHTSFSPGRVQFQHRNYKYDSLTGITPSLEGRKGKKIGEGVYLFTCR